MNGGSAGPQSDAMMETSPQANKTVNAFGASTSQPAPTTNGFSFNFGQPTPPSSQPSTGGFQLGQPKTQEQTSTPSLFGQTSSSQPQTNGFSFGESTKTPTAPSMFSQSTTQASVPALFGQSASSGAPAFSFGSTSTAAPSTTSTAAPTFKFGETSAVTDSQAKEATSKPKSSFGFGQTASFEQPAADAAPSTESAKPAWSFGHTAGLTPEGTSSKPAFSFGQPTTAPSQSESAGTTPKKSGFMSGQTADTTATSQPASRNLFGSLSKTAEPSSMSASLFGRASPADEAPQTGKDPNAAEQQKGENHLSEDTGPKNPFASLFSTKSQSESSTTTTKPLFNFGSPSKPTEPLSNSNGMFSSKQPDLSQQIEKSNQPSSAFQFSQPNQSSGGLFSPKADTAPTKFGDLFNLNKPAPPSEVSKEVSTPEKPASTSMFTPKPNNMTSNAGSTPFKFGQRNDEQEKSAGSRRGYEDTAPAEKKKLFTGSSTPSSMAKSAGVSFESKTSLGPLQPVQPKLPEKPTAQPETLNRAVSTEGPPQIPRFLSADKYKSYDENWRLKGLNRRFKQMVSKCDPDQHDFLNLVQNYLDHREATGPPGLVGLDRQKLDPVAGSKRKAIDVDDMQDIGDKNKKTRSEPALASALNTSQPKPASTPSNLFASVASPKAAATFSPVKATSDPNTSNLFKSMIPGATSSSTTTSTTPTFSFGGPSAPKSTTPPSSPPKPAAPQLPKFEIPKFGGTSGTNFSNAFAQAAAANAKKFEKDAKEKRKAEEFDSDEDDEETWNKKYEEEQRAKRAKIEAAARSLAVPGFVPSAESSRSNSPFNFGGAPAKSIERSVSPAGPNTSGSSKYAAISVESDGDQDSGTGSGESGNSGDDEREQAQAEDDLPEDQVDDDENDQEDDEEEGEPIPDLAPEKSLFSRVEKPAAAADKEEPTIFQPSANNSFKPGIMFGNIGKSTPDPPTFSPFTPATVPKGDFVPAKTFNFTPTPSAGSSVFGSNLKDGPVPGEGLFGSRPSTPQPSTTTDTKDTKPTSIFGAATSFGTSDNTWKAGSPIKFGSSTSERKQDGAPSVEVTAATPPAKDQSKPFAGLFGQSTSSSVPNGGTSLGFNFGNPSAASTSDKPAPGFLSAASHLGGGISSGLSSRGSSPGITSEAESVTTDTEETYNDPQASFMSANAGEENEDVLFESKAALSRMFKEHEIPTDGNDIKRHEPGWNKQGSGSVKVLKDRETGKCRIVFRAEPGANVLLNTRLISGAKYASQQTGRYGAVTFPVAVEGGMQLWMVKVKTKEDGERMAGILQENKGN